MFSELIPILLKYGYAGAFVSGFLSTFTIFIPSPTFVVVIVLGSELNPLILGLLGGLGAAVGEMVGYVFGYGAGKVIDKKEKIKTRIKKMIKKYHPMLIIFLFAANPIIPFDSVGLFFGSINYDKKKFFIATLLGKIAKYLILAYGGRYGFFVLKYYLLRP